MERIESLFHDIEKRIEMLTSQLTRMSLLDNTESELSHNIQKVTSTINLIKRHIDADDINQISNYNQDKIIKYFNEVRDNLEHTFINIRKNDGNLFEYIKTINYLLNQSLKIISGAILDFSNKKEFYDFFKDLDFEKYADKIEEFKKNYNQLKQIGENITSLHIEIKNKDKEISKQAQEIQEKYNAICQDVEDKDSLYTKVIKNSDRISQIEKQATEQLKTISHNLEEFKEKSQINNEFLNELEQQKEKINNWEREIENLLKKATNASLASSYEKAQEDYEKSIYFWNVFFILCMGGIAVISWKLFEGTEAKDYLSILILFVIKLPVYIPLACLAIFATNRRNENKRLQEEYKHKETLAKAYSGYKEQIEKLEDARAKELAEKLMNNLVEMTNENPNRALDKVKMEKIPIFEILEKLKDLPKEVLSLISKAKN